MLFLAAGSVYWLAVREGPLQNVASDLQVKTIQIRNIPFVNGEKVNSIIELTPPYELQPLGITPDFSQSNVVQVIEALWNIPKTGNEAYLALMDEGVRKKYEESDSGAKAEDPRIDLDARPPRSAITHWVDIESQGTLYRIVVGNQILPDGESPQFHLVFLDRDGRWFQTFDLTGSELKSIVGSTPLDELKKQFAK